MKTYYTSDLQKGMSLSGETFAVKEVQLTETKAKKPYYRVTLIDKTGSISGNIWGDKFSQVEKSSLKVGKVVVIDAVVEEFKGALTLNIDRVNGVSEAVLDEYVEGSDFDLDELMKTLDKFIEEISDPKIKKYLLSIFGDEEFRARYKIHPAAEYVHHSFRGGLLEHVVEMLELSNSLKKYYPEANYDIVTMGIILHDVGKLDELSVEGTVVQRTPRGYLIGHIALGLEYVENSAKEILKEEQLMLLKHIILSHHGTLEFGSPVVPSTIEAAIVSELDSSSSQVRIFQKVVRKSKNREDNFSDWDNILRTKVYQSKQNDELRLI
jgi:3'-5' exoribonuclease